MSDTFTLPSGSRIDGTAYFVVRPIGHGGMGEVYEVEHEMLGTRRALKILAKEFSGRGDLTERLRVEARGLARLKHPNLVEVYDLGTAHDGRIFYTMELLRGHTLREILRHRGRLTVAETVGLLGQALDGLHAAHCAGMIHRDVKPENVFVCDSGIVKLLDFGVAKAFASWRPAQQITAAGTTVGTPRYMSPEQAEGNVPIDARTDLYAAAICAWEALAGCAPFADDDLGKLAQAKLQTGVPPLTPYLAEPIPPALQQVILRACATKAADRFASAAVFADLLRRALHEAVPDSSKGAPFSADATVAFATLSDDTSSAVTASERARRLDPPPSSRRRSAPPAEFSNLPTVATDEPVVVPRAAISPVVVIIAVAMIVAAGGIGAATLLSRVTGARSWFAPSPRGEASVGAPSPSASARPPRSSSAATDSGAPVLASPDSPTPSGKLSGQSSATTPPSARSAQPAPSAPGGSLPGSGL